MQGSFKEYSASFALYQKYLTWLEKLIIVITDKLVRHLSVIKRDSLWFTLWPVWDKIKTNILTNFHEYWSILCMPGFSNSVSWWPALWSNVTHFPTNSKNSQLFTTQSRLLTTLYKGAFRKHCRKGRKCW